VVKIAPVPKQIIEKGIATAGLVACILTGKFVDALPFYRQEKLQCIGYHTCSALSWIVTKNISTKKVLA
jgi:transposase